MTMEQRVVSAKFSRNSIRNKVAKIHKLNSYFISLFLALFLCTSAARAGQLMVCQLYTIHVTPVPATKVGWFIYQGPKMKQVRTLTFPQYNDSSNLTEINTDNYFDKIRFHSDDQGKVLRADLKLDKNTWKYKVVSGSYNGETLAATTNCSPKLYFEDPLDANKVQSYLELFNAGLEDANYTSGGALPYRDSSSEEEKPSDTPLTRSKSFASAKVFKEYGVCTALVQNKNQLPLNNAWNLNIRWEYELTTAAEMNDTQRLETTIHENHINTHLSIHNKNNFETNNSRTNPHVTKIVGEIPLERGTRSWSISRSNDNWEISYGNIKDFNVVKGSVKCETSKEPLEDLELQPITPKSHRYVPAKCPDNEEPKEEGCCGSACAVS